MHYEDPESAQAAGAAAWARLNATETSAGLGAPPAGLAQVIAAARAAAAEGRAVDSEALSAVAAAAAGAEEDGNGEAGDCLEGDEADMTRLRRQRVSRYAAGAPGSDRAAAAAELGGQLRSHMAQSFSTSFTSGGVYGGGREEGGAHLPQHQIEPAASASAPAPPLAGHKRSRWSEGPPPPPPATGADMGQWQPAPEEAEAAAGSAANANALPPQAQQQSRASRFGPPAAAPETSLAPSVAAAATAAPPPTSTWLQQLQSFARHQAPVAGTGRGLYIPGVRY